MRELTPLVLYLVDMSRSLRAVRLAAGRLATFFNKLLVRPRAVPPQKSGVHWAE
jgi:hypothetical protein